ncbi:MAG: HPr-rel-A system PqqD family peptide chaperone [Desulfarculaceae bacterium]|nr:HPr-rel-A system PqqD family peptide chaperone [Desulfarculaceae bacterium]
MSQAISRQQPYQRIEEFTEGTFEQDLLVMHRDSEDTLMLNPTAAAIWEALQWPQSVDDLVGLLLEAFPRQPREELAAQVEQSLQTLLARGFIRPMA